MVQGCVAGIFTPESSIESHWGRHSAHKVLTVLTKHRLVPPLAWHGLASSRHHRLHLYSGSWLASRLHSQSPSTLSSLGDR